MAVALALEVAHLVVLQGALLAAVARPVVGHQADTGGALRLRAAGAHLGALVGVGGVKVNIVAALGVRLQEEGGKTIKIEKRPEKN